MSAALTLAGPDHVGKLLPLVEAFHAEAGIKSTAQARQAGVAPLLSGIPHGCVYLIGPPRAPIGYIVMIFGWSVEFGGLDAMIAELYIRDGVRRRGIASEALIALPHALAGAGLRAVHLKVEKDNAAALKLYLRAGFTAQDDYTFLSRHL